MITIVPLHREQHLRSNETQIRSRALPVNHPGPFAATHLALIEILDDAIATHEKAISSHREAVEDFTRRGLLPQAKNRQLHIENHTEIITGLNLIKLYHLDRLDQALSI